MRLPNTAHTSQPWRIHELTRDFRLEDVWALPTPGGPDDFPRLAQLIASQDPSQSSSLAVRTLFAIRVMMREIEREWRARVGGERTPAHAELRWLIPNPGSGKFGVNVFSGWVRRDFLHRIARIAEGSA